MTDISGKSPRPVADNSTGRVGLDWGMSRTASVYILLKVTIANVAPCGSANTANRPVPGMSVGGTNVWAPSDAACLAVASTFETEKYGSQWDGAGPPAGIAIIPPAGPSALSQVVYSPPPPG